ncbi:MAG: hypothetical protein VX733_02425, partial [Candidatus Latescibacterota bacterium]|nr:hypothetical protein [Candidatus Latescibacterota bacterium]
YALGAPRALMCQNGMLEPETQFHVHLAQQAFTEIEPTYDDFDARESLCLHIHPGGHEISLNALLQFLSQHLSDDEILSEEGAR